MADGRNIAQWTTEAKVSLNSLGENSVPMMEGMSMEEKLRAVARMCVKCESRRDEVEVGTWTIDMIAMHKKRMTDDPNYTKRRIVFKEERYNRRKKLKSSCD